MPGYKGHLLGGVVIYGIALYLLRSYCSSEAGAAQWLLCTLAGALFPDIDIKSKGQKYFYWGILITFIALIVMHRFDLLAMASVVSVAPMLAKHRGLFHEVWFVVMLPVAVWLGVTYVFPAYFYSLLFCTAFFVLGALSHLYLDRGWRGIVPTFLRSFFS